MQIGLSIKNRQVFVLQIWFIQIQDSFFNLFLRLFASLKGKTTTK